LSLPCLKSDQYHCWPPGWKILSNDTSQPLLLICALWELLPALSPATVMGPSVCHELGTASGLVTDLW
jgi:hypothetical protein